MDLNHCKGLCRPLPYRSGTAPQKTSGNRQRVRRMLLPVGFPAGQIRPAELGRLFYICGHLPSRDSGEVAWVSDTVPPPAERLA